MAKEDLLAIIERQVFSFNHLPIFFGTLCSIDSKGEKNTLMGDQKISGLPTRQLKPVSSSFPWVARPSEKLFVPGYFINIAKARRTLASTRRFLVIKASAANQIISSFRNARSLDLFKAASQERSKNGRRHL